MIVKRQISLLFLAQLIIIACLDMSDPYWPLIIHHANPGISAQHVQYWSAAVYIIPFLITIVATPIWSHFGEKVGHKKMLLRATCALAVSQLLVGFVTNPVLILAIRLIQGVFAGFTAAAQSWSISMSRPESHSHIIGRMQASTAVGTVVGPIIGGVIANYLGYSAIFFVSAMLCCMTISALAFYLQETPKKEGTSAPAKMFNLSHLDKNVVTFLSLICFTQAARWMSSSFFALYVIQRLGGTNLSVGILYSSIALSIFIAAPRWGNMIDLKVKQHSLVKIIFTTTLLCAGMSQYLFAMSSSITLSLFSCIMLGVCLGAISLIPFTLLVNYSQELHKSKMIGLGSSASKLGNLIGVATGALIQSQTNFTFSFIAIGVVYCLIASLSLRLRLSTA